jgi:hypothetical protein
LHSLFAATKTKLRRLARHGEPRDIHFGWAKSTISRASVRAAAANRQSPVWTAKENRPVLPPEGDLAITGSNQAVFDAMGQ